MQNVSVHIQRSWVSVRCETHATARVADFSPSLWPPPIDTGDLFWIIFSGQNGTISLSLTLSLCLPSFVALTHPVALSVSLFLFVFRCLSLCFSLAKNGDFARGPVRTVFC